MSGQEAVGSSAEITFGPLTDSDFAGISDLIRRMSSADGDQRLRDKSPAYYRWMYEGNPAGRATVYSARHRGDVVSTFAIAPKRVQIDGKTTVVGKTMDMFTDPAYQGRGLIKRCTQAVFEEASITGMRGWYVTPSVNSYPIFLGKWGYREDLHLTYRTRVLNFSEVLGAAVTRSRLFGAIGGMADGLLGVLPVRTARLPDGYEVVPIARFGAEVDELWARVAAGYSVALVRDSAYLNWRYVDNPDDYEAIGLTHMGALVGVIVLTTTIRRAVRVGEIMDYVCAVNDEFVFNTLVSLAMARLIEQGCAVVQAWSIKGTTEDKRLRRAGLVFTRGEVKFLFSPAFPDASVYDPAAWLLTQGDGNDV